MGGSRSGTTATMVQAFLIHRIYLLSGRKRLFPIILLVQSFVQLALSYAITAKIFGVDRMFSRFGEFR